MCHVHFALCPCCYVFWYVAKGRGQAASRTAGARSGGESWGREELQSQSPAALTGAEIRTDPRISEQNNAHACARGYTITGYRMREEIISLLAMFVTDKNHEGNLSAATDVHTSGIWANVSFQKVLARRYPLHDFTRLRCRLFLRILQVGTATAHKCTLTDTHTLMHNEKSTVLLLVRRCSAGSKVLCLSGLDSIDSDLESSLLGQEANSLLATCQERLIRVDLRKEQRIKEL